MMIIPETCRTNWILYLCLYLLYSCTRCDEVKGQMILLGSIIFDLRIQITPFGIFKLFY